MNLETAKSIISDLFAPYSSDDLFKDYISKQYLAITGRDRQDIADIVGDDPIAEILKDFEKYSHTLTSHNANPVTPPPSAKHTGSPEEFHELIKQYHANDYTIRIPDVEDLSPALTRLTRAIETLIHNPVGVVIFWSDHDAKAPIHYDEIDVIAIQLKGTKKWFISDAPSPLQNTWKAIGEKVPELSPHSTIDVEPSDVLYLPRGTTHSVHSTSESVHLSIGFHPVTQREALIALVDQLSEQNKGLRENLGERADDLAHGKGGTTLLKQIRDGLDELITSGKDVSFIQDALRLRYAKVLEDLPKLKVDENMVMEFDKTTIFRHSDLALAQVNKGKDIMDFRQPGQITLVHPHTEESLKFISKTEMFTLEDMPKTVDPEINKVLVHKFLSNGFLTTLKPKE